MGLPGTGDAIMIPSRGQLTMAILAAICATVIAACGSSSNPNSAQTGTGATQSALLVKFSACMRSHGVSGFPDPSTTETPNGFGIDGYNFDLPSTMNTQSPAYESADKTCQSVLGSGPSGGGPSAAVLASARKHALAHAECMREHGVPNYPDPTITGNGQGIQSSSGGAGISARSPAFQQAEKICGGG